MGKRTDKACEDGWIVTPHFAAVVDGSTAKIQVPPGQESPGHLAMRLTCETIAQLPPDATKEAALLAFTAAVAADSTYAQANYRPTCSAVVYSDFWHEVWFIGDCQCRCQGVTHHHEKLVDRLLTDMRCRAIRYYLNHGYTPSDIRRHDKGRAFIYDALCDQLHFQNDPNLSNPYRYPVIDGQPIHPSDVPVLSVSGASTLILASDGYPQLFDTLAETEHYLAYVLQADPLCIQQNPSSKCLAEGNLSFDDRTYLSLSITAPR